MIPQSVKADEWSDAETFYKKYGSEAVFHGTSTTDGEIYFASRGASASTGIRYRTIGWKLKVLDADAKAVQSIYFVLDGKYLKLKQKKKTDSYQYNMYALKLSDIKGRMSKASLELLNSGSAKIVLDACMVVVIDGVTKGGMTDSGPSWGMVYTTYAGISKAQSWSSTSMTTLKTYFNKNVTNLFYKITVSKDAGISSVSGAGTYCYGTTVNLVAKLKEGYAFAQWVGATNAKTEKTSFAITKSYSVSALSLLKSISVNYQIDADKKYTYSQNYTYGVAGNKYLKASALIPGYHMLGWSETKSVGKVDFAEKETIANKWIDQKFPIAFLYGVLEENKYKVKFESQDEIIAEENASYRSTIILTDSLEDTRGFMGWSIDLGEHILPAKEQVSVEELVKNEKLEYTNNAEIVFHAIWQNYPRIEANDIFLPLDIAKSGLVNESFLKTYAKAVDDVDGELQLGIRGVEALDFTALNNRDTIAITFFSKNKRGYESEKTVNLTVVDTGAKRIKNLSERVRFISKEYAFLSDWGNSKKRRELLKKAGLL